MSSVTFAVGDIHGCLDKLEGLLAACDAHVRTQPGAEARFVFLGDYIDRGPDSRGVVELLIRRQQAAAPGGVVCLRGNHEQLAVDAYADPAAGPLWQKNSALATQRSYPDGRISPDHLAWLAALPFCHDDGLRFYVHAGIDLALPLEHQPHEVLLWMREPFLSHCDEIDRGRFIVHGHTPQKGGRPDLRRRRVNVDTAAVLGGPLTAAVFDDSRAEPVGFLTDGERPRRWWPAWLGG